MCVGMRERERGGGKKERERERDLHLLFLQEDSTCISGEEPIQGDSRANSSMPLTTKTSNPSSPVDECREPTVPHGPCRDKPADESRRGSVLHPRRSSSSREDQPISKPASKVHMHDGEKFLRGNQLFAVLLLKLRSVKSCSRKE